MSIPLFHSQKSRFPKHLLLLGCCGLLPFLACRTQDPTPGVDSGGRMTSGSSSGGRSGSGGSSGNATGKGGSVSFAEGGMGGTDAGETVMDRECGDAPVSSKDFSKKVLLESAGECSAYYACLFSNAAAELGRRVTGYADDPSEETLEQARSAWVEAMDVWAMAVPAQYGPVASVAADSYHGRGIGSFIHAWPSLNRCELEKQVVTRAYEEQGFQRILPGARGLSALEYLLFYEGSDTACASNSSTAKAWVELSADEITQAKRDYAKAVVEDVYLKAEELVNVWAGDGENFGVTLANSEGYGSEQEALNVVAWSLLYVYSEVRDLKVGPLAGIGTALPNPMSPYARVDLPSIHANLKAFRALFQGCGLEGEGIGFDDWLEAAGAGELSQDILQALQNIEAHAAELPPLHEASSEQMAAFYADLKVLSDLLKEQFFGSGSVLNLKLPASAASDTD